jgi:NADPH:quinone reductase-like Zn-dependent oxidoreductase
MAALSRVVRFHEVGGPEVLRIERMAPSEPGPGELRLRVEAIGLNRAEAAFRAGQYFEPPQFPARIGYEASAIVDALGPEVQGFAPGDRVCVLPGFAMSRYGVYGDHAIAPVGAVIRRPAGMDAVTGAAVWMQYLTAYGALVDIAHVAAGDAVVITAASSSVGIATIQICNLLGATSIAVTRDAAKAEQLRRHGATHVVVGGAHEAATETLRLTEGRGARLVFDPVAGPGVVALADALAPGGVLVLYGNLSGQADQTPFPFRAAVGKGASLRGYLVFELISNPRRLAQAVAFIGDGIAAGRLKPVIARTFPLDAIVEAHQYLESNQQIGKIIVVTDQAQKDCS